MGSLPGVYVFGGDVKLTQSFEPPSADVDIQFFGQPVRNVSAIVSKMGLATTAKNAPYHVGGHIAGFAAEKLPNDDRHFLIQGGALSSIF